MSKEHTSEHEEVSRKLPARADARLGKSRGSLAGAGGPPVGWLNPPRASDPDALEEPCRAPAHKASTP